MLVSFLFVALSGVMKEHQASACTFPFVYERRSFFSCIPNGRNDRKYWCATTSNYDLDRAWELCPVSELLVNSSVAFCLFPFLFQGKSYFSCTTDGRTDGRYWCATTSNYDQDGQWVYCSGSNGGLRLVSGGDPCAGRLEMHYPLGGWGTVCHAGWDMRAANLVCQELECGHAVAAPVNSYYGASSGPIWANHLHCAEKHLSLQECPGLRAKKGKAVSCNHSMESGVICSDYGKLRLVNGEKPCSGRVEVYFSSHWGTVCDRGWGMVTADVVCRQLGCGQAVSSVGGAHFGEGTGPIWLDSVKCTGAESFLWQCGSNRLKEHNCTHKQDAGITCSGGPLSDTQQNVQLLSPVLSVIGGLLAVFILALIGWIIKRKRSTRRPGPRDVWQTHLEVLWGEGSLQRTPLAQKGPLEEQYLELSAKDEQTGATSDDNRKAVPELGTRIKEEMNTMNKELDEAPESVYENIDWKGNEGI